MGSGAYSFSRSVSREASYATKSTSQIFSSSSLDSAMDPKNTVRECRDSADHPKTIPIIIALDVTGSMGYVPDRFVRNEMTKMMSALFEAGVKDAQVLFIGIGDHECDHVPLQVGQFEADDQLMDKWLKAIYLEGGGGGNAGESYLLAWKYAADHTIIDSFEKRSEKGFLFTIGDEPTLKSLPSETIKSLLGTGQASTISASELLVNARKKYHVKHLHLTETNAGSKKSTQDGWREMIGDDLIVLQSYSQIAETVASVVKGKHEVITPLQSNNYKAEISPPKESEDML